MKPIYDSYTRTWSVKNLGYFNTHAEAKEAIANNQYTEGMRIMLKPKVKEKLKEISDREGISLSEVVRRIIEKEVDSYEEKNRYGQ